MYNYKINTSFTPRFHKVVKPTNKKTFWNYRDQFNKQPIVSSSLYCISTYVNMKTRHKNTFLPISCNFPFFWPIYKRYIFFLRGEGGKILIVGGGIKGCSKIAFKVGRKMFTTLPPWNFSLRNDLDAVRRNLSPLSCFCMPYQKGLNALITFLHSHSKYPSLHFWDFLF